MPTADLIIGTTDQDIEARAGEGPWKHRYAIVDGANLDVPLTGATITMVFTRGAVPNTYSRAIANGLEVGSPNNVLIITLKPEMAKGDYNHVITIALLNGVTSIIKGVTRIK